jgi:hypothetical protein
MREVFLLACIDVEHFSKMRVLRLCEERHEDGYAHRFQFCRTAEP